MKVMVVLGEGGHSKEMLSLVELLGPSHEYSYLLVKGDELSEKKIAIAGRLYYAQRPRDKAHHLLLDVVKTLRCGWDSLVALLRERPAAVISCGPAVGVPPCVMAKLLGIRVIFVETGSRVRALSMTGRIVYRFADLFLVQWPQLLAKCAKAIYAGRFW